MQSIQKILGRKISFTKKELLASQKNQEVRNFKAYMVKKIYPKGDRQARMNYLKNIEDTPQFKKLYKKSLKQLCS